jgi:hypothetical protein
MKTMFLVTAMLVIALSALSSKAQTFGMTGNPGQPMSYSEYMARKGPDVARKYRATSDSCTGASTVYSVSGQCTSVSSGTVVTPNGKVIGMIIVSTSPAVTNSYVVKGHAPCYDNLPAMKTDPRGPKASVVRGDPVLGVAVLAAKAAGAVPAKANLQVLYR